MGSARGVLWEVISREGGALTNGICALIKRPQRAHLPLLPGEDTENATHEPGSGLSPDPEWAATLILGFPASGTMRNEFLFDLFVCLFVLN